MEINRQKKSLEEYKNQLLALEKVLAQFSKEAQINYYKNKETLEIFLVDEMAYHEGSYNFHDNIIEIVDESSILHELVHMAFSNKNDLDKEISRGLFKKNGIVYYDKIMHCGRGLNEGFTESLARKAGKTPNSRGFETYIANLLVSIYGDEIYEFPLNNDPIGFYNYCSENIDSLSAWLDLYLETLDNLYLMNHLINKGVDLPRRFTKKTIKIFKKNYPQSLIKCIIAIINEYNSCPSPKITRTEFKTEIEKYFDSVLFEEASIFFEKKLRRNLRQELEEIIDTELMAKRYIK